jgi:hypothetical protein
MKPISTATEDLRLLHVDIDAMFLMSASGRIERENDPDCSPGPRVFFAGCRVGNITRIRHDVEDRVARSVLDIFAKEPPWRDPDLMPEGVAKIAELLPEGQRAVNVALIYRLPNGVTYDHSAPIVRGDSAEGQAMLARLAEVGMPEYMQAAGFKGVGDFWEPWCVALDDGEIASMAFAARLGKTGAEIGVYTFPKYRGRGLAAAVTANWASMPSLSHRALFYSAANSNKSSQRVTARLGLRRIGASVRIG